MNSILSSNEVHSNSEEENAEDLGEDKARHSGCIQLNAVLTHCEERGDKSTSGCESFFSGSFVPVYQQYAFVWLGQQTALSVGCMAREWPGKILGLRMQCFLMFLSLPEVPEKPR